MTHVIAAAPQYTLANTCKSMMRVQFALIPERETCELCTVHRVGVAFPEGLKLLPFYENLAKRQLLPFYAHSLSVTFTV